MPLTSGSHRLYASALRRFINCSYSRLLITYEVFSLFAMVTDDALSARGFVWVNGVVCLLSQPVLHKLDTFFAPTHNLMSLAVRSQPARSVSGAKPKTKAKQRYLKTKKERRKARKAAGPRPFGEGKKKRAEGYRKRRTEKQDASESENGKDDAMNSEEESESDDSSAHDTSVAEAMQDTTMEDAHQPASPRHMDDESLQGTSREPSRSPSPSPQYLYRFPRPQQTAEADAHLLASQGIPEALLHPTDVATSATQALDTPHAGVHLSAATRDQLSQLGITEWFAVQASVMPELLGDERQRQLYMPYTPPSDLCISAPTGSGKTLAYTVPIVDILRTRTVVQLRALIVVPTRDLAVQVREVFDAVGKGSGLRVATITGNHSFRHEQEQVGHADVLIATPGRLVDHIRGTPNFTLEHLRFLVIDEADRLLGQSFQQWVSIVLDALDVPTRGSTVCAPQALWSKEPAWMHDDVQVPRHSVQKLLFSATLTRDPAKIGALRLRTPRFIRVREGECDAGAFALPATLRQHMHIVPTSQKVLYLLHLLHGGSGMRHALCFTKSVDAANRLVRLIAFFEDAWSKHAGQSPLRVRFYSSDLRTSERKHMLREFERGDVDVLVCSDLIARGIDLPDVAHVVSYDVPVDMAMYVHRVGRTARAGRTGDAWSLVEEQEVYHFKRMLRDGGQLERVERHKVKESALEPYMPAYKEALAQLASVYSQQRQP